MFETRQNTFKKHRAQPKSKPLHSSKKVLAPAVQIRRKKPIAEVLVQTEV
jgi:hypothetical protein